MSTNTSRADGTVLQAAELFTGDAFLAPGWLETRGERITTVGQGQAPRPPDLDLGDALVVAGFVDTHVHGGGGASFASTDPGAVAVAAGAHLAHGTTTLVASLVTAPQAELTRQVRVLAGLVEEGVLGGIHLEGPWLSPRFKGAHDPLSLAAPDVATVAALLDAARGTVRMVTLAPELDGGLAAIRQVVGHGAVAAVGHTAADYDTTRAAIAAGASVATHLFNAMPPLHHRSPGPVVALMEDPRVTVEVIVDGVHLHPAAAAFAMRGAAGGFSLVTDAMAAAAARDGRYELGGLAVDVVDGVATLAGSDTIAGSTLTMAEAVRRAVASGVDRATALRAATAGPAAALGLAEVGTLERGRRADLVVLDADLQVQRVMRGGRWQ